MAASASDIARLRRMAGEFSSTTYSNADLATFIERYPAVDERGVNPYYWDTSTTPPTQTAVTGWIVTYDLHAAAAEIWEEKAAADVREIDYVVSEPIPGTVSRSQIYTQAMTQVRFHMSRRKPGTIRLIADPSPIRLGSSAVINAPEQDY